MRKLQYLFMTLSALFMAVPAFAQTSGGGASSTGHGLTAIAAGLGMGIAAGLCGLGQGRATDPALRAALSAARFVSADGGARRTNSAAAAVEVR